METRVQRCFNSRYIPRGAREARCSTSVPYSRFANRQGVVRSERHRDTCRGHGNGTPSRSGDNWFVQPLLASQPKTWTPYIPRASSLSPPSPSPSPHSRSNEPFLQSMKSQLDRFAGLWGSFLPMCSLFFFMAFINTIVNSLSLTLIVTAPGGGAEVIPYLTVYGALPASLLFMVGYAYASQHMDRGKLFNRIVGLFAVLNLVFALFLYPNHQSLHLHGISDALMKVVPAGLSGAVGMIRNWTFTFFYCVSELWGDVGLSLLFWGFANEITELENAPILYPLFGIGANVAQLLGGLVLRVFSTLTTDATFVQSFQKLIMCVVACKVCVVALHHWIEQKAKVTGRQKVNEEFEERGETVDSEASGSSAFDNGEMDWGRWEKMLHQSDRHGLNGASGQQGKARISRVGNGNVDVANGTVLHASWRDRKEVTVNGGPLESDNGKGDVEQGGDKVSLWDALKTLSKSPEIRALGVMTIAQSLAVNLMEFVWKCQLRVAYPTPAAFSGFMGDVATATGLVTGTLMFVSPILFDKLGWGQVADVTPNLLTWGGSAFFVACMGFQVLNNMGLLHWANTVLPFTVIGGAVLYVLARGAKFSLFKPAEEMVYIQLDSESRTKGKAAIDVVGAQLGKSGGSILQQGLLLLSGGALLGITPIMFVVYVVMLYGWRDSVKDLASRQDKGGAGKLVNGSSDASVLNFPQDLALSNGDRDDIEDDRGGASLLTASALAT